MQSAPPQPQSGTVDLEHLRILSIVYYVFAGLNCIGLCFGFLYLIVGGLFLVGSTTGSKGPPAMVGGLFVAMAVVILLIVGTTTLLNYLTGRFLSQHRHRTFCFVVAAISCLSFPLGTALGVFTIIVLSRPSVKALFEESDRPVESPQA